uniref:Uncharacterized protein n=1 Tax=Zooxanthella nutricula TaxID=1333877 RepID=A0A7S2PUU7_9DINO
MCRCDDLDSSVHLLDGLRKAAWSPPTLLCLLVDACGDFPAQRRLTMRAQRKLAAHGAHDVLANCRTKADLILAVDMSLARCARRQAVWPACPGAVQKAAKAPQCAPQLCPRPRPFVVDEATTPMQALLNGLRDACYSALASPAECLGPAATRRGPVRARIPGGGADELVVRR